MDSGRAFQLREQVIRRHRLGLAVCALAVLVFVCVIVSLLLKYALNIDNSREDDTKRLLQIGGSWGQWLPWSPCSASCGRASHTRRRYCDDPEPENDGSHCDGEYQQTATCADWPCPDCNRECGEGWLRDCSYCFCAPMSLQGQVLDVRGIPINDVKIFLFNMQWEPLTETNSGGYFVLKDVCEVDMELIIKKTGYETSYFNATALSRTNADVKMTLPKLVRHRITIHPQDTTVFQGNTLTLTCGSDSLEVNYEWYALYRSL